MSQYYNPNRSRNLYNPTSTELFRLYRSKIDLFVKCPRCFYLDRRLGVAQPPGYPFSLNSAVDALSEKLPNGIVENQEGWVESKPVPDTNVFIKGKYDLLVKLSDDTHLLIDLKISTPGDDKIEKYKTQLTAYKFALENPANGNPIKLSRLGLLIFYPDQVSFEKGSATLTFPPSWLEVPADQEGFLIFAKAIDKLLSGPTPEEGKECKWCKYRHLGDTLAHTEAGSERDETIPF